MADSKQLLDFNLWDKTKEEWIPGAPKTHDNAVFRADGTTVKDALNEIPGAINDAITLLKGGVAADGDTLAKLQSKITAIQTALASDEIDLDTLQEVVDYIKANRDALDIIRDDKVDKEDIVNDLNTVVPGKVLDAAQGKVLKGFIDTLQNALSNLQTLSESFATKTELNELKVTAVLTVSDTAPVNPVNGQFWLKPVGEIVV